MTATVGTQRARSRPAQPPVQPWRLAVGTEHELAFTGQRLGHSTSRSDRHAHHPANAGHPGNRKCHACRWLEVAVYRRFLPEPEVQLERDLTLTSVDSDYVLYTVGGSTVPGEQQLVRVTTTASAHELLELLTVRKDGSEPFIAVQSLRALAQAAQFDPEVENAYVNRAIV